MNNEYTYTYLFIYTLSTLFNKVVNGVNKILLLNLLCTDVILTSFIIIMIIYIINFIKSCTLSYFEKQRNGHTFRSYALKNRQNYFIEFANFLRS